MSSEDSAGGLDATLREFAGGQKLFGRYTLVKTLGRGGMGVVWLARDEELERDVALKFLPDLIVRDRAVLSDMKRETRRSLELTHKNIVRIHDFIFDDKSGCISMEYIDGDTLSNLRVDRPQKVFEPAELGDWTSQLCDALDYAHNHARIIHRDLKPSNLMVNGRGELKVADFGIARSLNESVSMLTMQQGRSGTLLYMSPQQLEGERGSHLDDIYSVGASLYELITSKPPFYFGNIDRQIREKTPPRMTVRRQELEIEGSPISPAWENLVRSCLEKNPERRPQSVAAIAEQLAVAGPKTRRARIAPPKQSKSRISMLAAIGVLAGLAGMAVWYFGVLQPKLKRRVAETPPPPVLDVSPAPAKVRETPSSAVTPALSSSPVTTIAGAESKLPAAAGSTYAGTIHVRNDNSISVPLFITLGADSKSGTMTQSGRRGDVVVRFSGVWDGPALHAVTDQVVSTPKGINWQPESFTLRFADDGKTASYECSADGKMFVADLSVQSSSLGKIGAVYKGTIHTQAATGPGTPLAINFSPDRKSGTMTQTSKFGDIVVRFTGIWDGNILRAVASEVVSKPKNIQWKPESFIVRFSETAARAAYECNSDGQLYTAELTPP
ncbi:MAG TPA: serine/threonine-protein kinase [Chthoniobacterales bacterium]|nr:serine/threonine-protein kinase [Chthoniobacterales bacterium]